MAENASFDVLIDEIRLSVFATTRKKEREGKGRKGKVRERTQTAVVYGECAPSYATVKRWAAEFRQGRNSLEDEPRS